MIIFHATLAAGHFLLWGEASQSAAPRSGRKAKKIPRSPYDADSAGLVSALEEIFSGLTLEPEDFQTVSIWLPTVEGKPIPSSPMLIEGDAHPSSGKTEIFPWAITALPLAWVEAVELLSLCIGKTSLASGVLIGADLAYWALALRFAGALVARQQFLPGVRVEEGEYLARWEPVIAGPDAARLSQLAKAMPHACRAMQIDDDAVEAPATPATELLQSFLDSTVDHLVRSTKWNDEAESATKRSHASLHDQWLEALYWVDPRLTGTPAELSRFQSQVAEWRRPLTPAMAGAFRLCFRLEEPELPAEAAIEKPARRQAMPADWYVQYLLQSNEDPSLLIPVKEAWRPKPQLAATLARQGFKAREFLLSSLGQAASLSPHIEPSLKTAEPAGYALNSAGAHAFLTQESWMLEQSGFGVLLPAWWSRKGTKQQLTARAKVKSPPSVGSGLTLDALVRFDWEVALGDQTLSLSELQELARLKSPLVRIRGQWVQLNAEEIQAAIAFWKKKGEGQATLRELVHMSLGAGKAPGGLAVQGVQAQGWIGDFLSQLDGRAGFEELPVPSTFQGTLRPYQVRGFSWLAFLRRWGLGACLADDMGLGKTVQTLAMIERDWQANGKRPVLLICPMSVVGNWQKEAARFTPDLPVMIHHGLTRTKDAAFKKEARKQAIVVSSYALLHRDQHLFDKVEWAGVILDEAQNIKNAETKQSRAARALKSDYRVALTGTPVENNVGDLWSIMEFLNPGFLGTHSEFKRRFFVPIQAQRDAEASARLKRLTAPFILRRLKTDRSIISDLPEKLEMKVFCTLTREQASLYAAVVKEMSESLEEAQGIQRKGMVLATLTRLKQVCNHPAHFLGDRSAIPGRSGKLARLTEMLEEAIAEGDRALIFTQFAEMGEIIKRHLQESFGEEALFLHGGKTKKERDRMVERFQQESGGPRLFVLSLKAGGTGLNLTAASHVFHFDRWWNPAVENQATDRAFRIGQKRNVQVHKFLCAGTLEERIDEMIERKKEIASSIVGTGEGWLTELSNDALRDLFTLRQEAISE